MCQINKIFCLVTKKFCFYYSSFASGQSNGKFEQIPYSTGRTKRNSSNKTLWFRKLRERDFSSRVARETLRKKSTRELSKNSYRFKRRDIFCPAARIADNFPSVERTSEKWAMHPRSFMKSDWPQSCSTHSTFKEQIESIIRPDRTKFQRTMICD